MQVSSTTSLPQRTAFTTRSFADKRVVARHCVCASRAYTQTYSSLERNRHRSRRAVTKRRKKSCVLRTAHFEVEDLRLSQGEKSETFESIETNVFVNDHHPNTSRRIKKLETFMKCSLACTV